MIIFINYFVPVNSTGVASILFSSESLRPSNTY